MNYDEIMEEERIERLKYLLTQYGLLTNNDDADLVKLDKQLNEIDKEIINNYTIEEIKSMCWELETDYK